MFKSNSTKGVEFMTAPNIGTIHGFTTRYGGASAGIYESMNLGQSIGDDNDNVKENFARLRSALGLPLNCFVCTKQVHGKQVSIVTQAGGTEPPTPPESETDALITNVPGVALVIFVADCVPILLFDDELAVVAAVHAGWRGTALNISGTAVSKMAETYGCSPGNIKAAIGPSISQCCYETDIDVADAMRSVLGSDAELCIKPAGEKYMIDLKEANRLLLLKAGVTNISISDECTSCSSQKYWSHRKTKGQRGSQGAVIALK